MNRMIGIGILVALLGPGCAQVDRGSLRAFGQAVTAARLQADTAFQAVNELARENQFDRAAEQDSLDEENLRPVLASENIQKWDNAFREIEGYAENLVRLLSPDAPAGVRGSILALGDRLEALDAAAVPSPAVREGFVFGTVS